MTINERRRVYAEAVARYGEAHQLLKVVEELGEVIAEIPKWADPERDSNLWDEVADAVIVLEQLAMIAEIPEDWLNERIAYKVGRLHGRMGG